MAYSKAPKNLGKKTPKKTTFGVEQRICLLDSSVFFLQVKAVFLNSRAGRSVGRSKKTGIWTWSVKTTICSSSSRYVTAFPMDWTTSLRGARNTHAYKMDWFSNELDGYFWVCYLVNRRDTWHAFWPDHARVPGVLAPLRTATWDRLYNDLRKEGTPVSHACVLTAREHDISFTETNDRNNIYLSPTASLIPKPTLSLHSNITLDLEHS